MNIAKYNIFVKAVQLENITKAAEQLGYTQSAASHMISSLEDEIGCQLLIRERNGVHITDFGKQIYPLALDIVNTDKNIFELANSFNSSDSGIIRVGTFTSVTVQWMPEITRKFNNIYPNITIQIKDGNYDEIESWIINGKVDCGFLTKTNIKNFKINILKEDKLLVILPKNHYLCQYDKIHINLLEKENIIIPEEGTNYDVGQILKRANIKPSKYLNLNVVSDYSAVTMVRKGLGITILPKLIIDSLSKEGIEIRELQQYDKRSICLAINRQNKISPTVKKFICFTKEWVNNTLK